MNFISGFIIYISLWIVLLFMILPIGVRRSTKPEKGWDPGAPEKANVGKKMLITTGIAGLLWIIVYYVVTVWFEF